MTLHYATLVLSTATYYSVIVTTVIVTIVVTVWCLHAA